MLTSIACLLWCIVFQRTCRQSALTVSWSIHGNLLGVYSWGHCKSWTLDCGLDHGLDYGLRFGLNFGLLSNKSGHNSVKDEVNWAVDLDNASGL